MAQRKLAALGKQEPRPAHHWQAPIPIPPTREAGTQQLLGDWQGELMCPARGGPAQVALTSAAVSYSVAHDRALPVLGTEGTNPLPRTDVRT